jgi:Flp pilus assembly protein TadD
MRFFGKKEKAGVPASAAADPPVQNDLRNNPNFIRVFDKFGRELFIAKEKWRTDVLPSSIKSKWDDPEQLYGVITMALKDGFFQDVLEAAQHLYHIDPTAARGACIYGIVLTKTKRLDEAEHVLRGYLHKHGEDGSVLTNLAKVYAARNETQKCDETLWHSLEIDPNQDNGLAWFAAVHYERGGAQARLEAWQRVAALPGSWRAQLWLAREALQTGNMERAVAIYREGLSRIGADVPTDFLMQMSGDLGSRSHLPELLQLTEPHFVPEIHGLSVGNNLIKAHLDLGQIEGARKVLDKLYALRRPDWKENLSFWDTEIAKKRIATTEVLRKAPLEMTLLTIEGPIWLKPSSPVMELFPAKSQDVPVVSFLGSTAEGAARHEHIHAQLADAPGRLSRALPLFLAEQLEFSIRARAQTFVPWIAENGGCFVLCGVAWSDEDAVKYSRQAQVESKYVVTTHLKVQAGPWITELRVVRVSDGSLIGSFSVSFKSAKPEDAIPELSLRLLSLLTREAGLPTQASTPYQVPQGASFPNYLLRLEQLLALRCAGMDGAANSLNGEREIIDGNMQLCLACPENIGIRILFAQTLLAMKRIRPDVVREFKDKVSMLQKEKPLSEPAHSLVQGLLNDAMILS